MLGAEEVATLEPFGKAIFSLAATRTTTPDSECSGAPSLPTTPVTVLASGCYRYRVSWTDGSGSHSSQVAAFASILSDGTLVTLGEAADASAFDVDADFSDDTISATLETDEAPWFRLALPTCGANTVFDLRFAQGYEPDGNMNADDMLCSNDVQLWGQAIANGAVSYEGDGYFLAGDVDADGDMDSSDLAILMTRCGAADFNCDGFVDAFDYDDFVTAFETPYSSGDFNGDGFIDGFDYDDFITAFENAECEC